MEIKKMESKKINLSSVVKEIPKAEVSAVIASKSRSGGKNPFVPIARQAVAEFVANVGKPEGAVFAVKAIRDALFGAEIAQAKAERVKGGYLPPHLAVWSAVSASPLVVGLGGGSGLVAVFDSAVSASKARAAVKVSAPAVEVPAVPEVPAVKRGKKSAKRKAVKK